MKPDLRTRVEKEIRQGRGWRAKEILAGHIGNDDYDPELYALYGRVLRRLGDEVEAGKYLFLSGEVQGDEQQAVALFLARCGPGEMLHASFPARARNLRIRYYPDSVRAELEARNYGGGTRSPQDPPELPSEPTDLIEAILGAGCAIAFLLWMLFTFVGAWTVIQWILP